MKAFMKYELSTKCFIFLRYKFKLNYFSTNNSKINTDTEHKEKTNLIVTKYKDNNVKSISNSDFNKISESKIKDSTNLTYVNHEINQKIFNKIFETSSQENNVISNADFVSLNSNSNGLVNKTAFISTLDRTIDVKGNSEFAQLILENKLDFSKEKLHVKSLNIADQELNERTNEEIYEIDLGKIKSFPILNMNLNLSEETLSSLRDNTDYEFDISVVGRRISKEDEQLNLNNYVALNESSQHYISPIIFHDEQETSNGTVDYKDTILSTMLKNPIIIIIFIVFGYYVYPTLWKKDYFMALSEDYNNDKIVEEGSDGLYDYINYRRGLYVSVRSNFS